MLLFCDFSANTVLFFLKTMPSEYQNQDNQTAFILFSVEKSMLSAMLSLYFLRKSLCCRQCFSLIICGKPD